MFNVLDRITQLREAKGLSVYKLAKITGIPQSSIATWYQRNQYPPVDKIELICNSLGISLSEFFSVDELDLKDAELSDKWILLTKTQQNSIMSVIDAFLTDK
ncbi:MAG: helix-turn-helix domain-containing protein [Butyrivibrio sp.]|nr:helix-turn-helix domain-containing protein [Butyrivibrio sp.]